MEVADVLEVAEPHIGCEVVVLDCGAPLPNLPKVVAPEPPVEAVAALQDKSVPPPSGCDEAIVVAGIIPSTFPVPSAPNETSVLLTSGETSDTYSCFPYSR